MTKPVIIIDGYGFVFRAFHVQAPLTSPGGLPVGALYGFTSMLLKLLNDFKPSKAVIVFDSIGKSFRSDIYPQYKAHRPPVPEDLKIQMPLVRIAAKALNFHTLEQTGVEADDIIASLAISLSRAGEKSLIISSDKDLMQLLSDDISFYDPMKAKYIKEEDILEKFGVTPDKIRDVLALIGDKSDNIPGVASIGPKTAAELINKFGTLEEIFARADEIPQEKRRQVIKNGREAAFLSYELLGLKTDLNIDLSNLSWSSPNRNELINFIAEYGFKSLISRAEKLFGMDLELSSKYLQQNFNIDGIAGGNIDDLKKSAVKTGYLALYLSTDQFLLATKDNIICNLPVNESDKIYDLIKNISVKKITVNLKSMVKNLSGIIEAEDFRAFEDLSIINYVTSAGISQPYDEFWVRNGITSFFSKYDELYHKIHQNNAFSIYYDIDLPLSFLLAQMELYGILIDKSYLVSMSEDFTREIDILERKVFDICGFKFNIASPKQLGEILFEQMKLPGGKASSKTKTFSTGIEVLEYLSELGFEIADYLIRWRQITKLKNTYTDSLVDQIDPKTSRIHTNFLQNSTSTGRLSSHNPNLQNIPIKSAEGAKIRNAFIARPGYKIVSADYSQIELRVLSCIANIKSMQSAFKNNIDIHRATAAEVFKMDSMEVTPDIRRKAKAINFGIIYGISDFGLAKQLGITKQDAAKYISSYFQEYPGIEEYMSNIKSFVRENGYVENIFGRKCFFPNIKDANYVNRSFIERAAINAPIQSSAADIVKLAMIAVDQAIKKSGLSAVMMLQIHDELIFEVLESDLPASLDIIKTSMENVVNFEVPMTVDISSGYSWGD